MNDVLVSNGNTCIFHTCVAIFFFILRWYFLKLNRSYNTQMWLGLCEWLRLFIRVHVFFKLYLFHVFILTHSYTNSHIFLSFISNLCISFYYCILSFKITHIVQNKKKILLRIFILFPLNTSKVISVTNVERCIESGDGRMKREISTLETLEQSKKLISI